MIQFPLLMMILLIKAHMQKLIVLLHDFTTTKMIWFYNILHDCQGLENCSKSQHDKL